MALGGLLSLRWNNHCSTFLHILSTLHKKHSYDDATVACDGKLYPVHKLVLSTCSDYFEEMFEKTQGKHPVIVLKDIKSEVFEALLKYMYIGEVNVIQEKLSELINAAECLKIKGLAAPDEEPDRGPRTSRSSSGVNTGKRKQDHSESYNPPSKVHKSHVTGGSSASSRVSSDSKNNFSNINSNFRSHNRNNTSVNNDASRENHEFNSPVKSSPTRRKSSTQDDEIEEIQPQVKQEPQDTLESTPIADGGAGDIGGLQTDDGDEAREGEDVAQGEREDDEQVDSKYGILEGEQSADHWGSVLKEGEAGDALNSLLGADNSGSSNNDGRDGGDAGAGDHSNAGAADIAAGGDDSSAGVWPHMFSDATSLPRHNFSGAEFTCSTSQSYDQVYQASLQAEQLGFNVFSEGDHLLESYSSCDATNEFTQEKRYRCSLCRYATDILPNFNRHAMCHSGRRPYGCNYCNYRSSEKKNVVRHTKSRHTANISNLTSDKDIPVTCDKDVCKNPSASVPPII